jgi:hypothetical protein
LCANLFLSGILFQLLFASGHLYSFDEAVILDTAIGIAERGDPAISPTPEKRLYSKPGSDGRLYSKFGLGMSAAIIPIYAIGRTFAWLSSSENGRRAAEILTCFSNALIVAAIPPVFLLTLVQLGSGIREAVVTSVLLAFCTTLAVYGRGLFNDALTGLCVLWSYRMCLLGRPVLSGGIAGVAIACRMEYGVILPALAIMSGKRRGLHFVIAAAVILAFLGVYNAVRFGSASDQGTLTADPLDTFSTPLLTGLAGLFASPGKGVLWYTPPLWLAIAGIASFWKSKQRGSLLLIFMVLPAVILHAKWHSWMGGWSYGPRRMIALLPLLMLPAAGVAGTMMASRKGRMGLAVIAVAGFAAQFGGLTVNFMHYIARARGSVLWSIPHSGMIGQVVYLLETRKIDLWYVHLFGESPIALGIGGMLAGAWMLSLLSLTRATQRAEVLSPQ